MSTPTTVPSTSATIEPGRLVAGRYLLLARVGRGGSGSVWRAHDQLLDREVAVKRLHGGQAIEAVRPGMVRERAHREGRVAARLHHPRLAAIYDMTELDGEVCLVMEYVAAPSLADLLDREGPLPAGRVASIGLQIAEGLAAMHRTGIVHRDIKPANIMIGPDDTVTVTDFGIAVFGSDPGMDSHLVAGTPHYMAPELALGGVPTTKADMFSLGATLHAALAGAPPRPGASDVLEGLCEIAPDVVRPARRTGQLGVMLRALLDLDPVRRPGALLAARRLAEVASAVGPVGADLRSFSALGPGPTATSELTAEDGDGDRGTSSSPAAVGGARASDDVDDATPEQSQASAGLAGRHRVVRAAWRRPSRRVVLGTGLAGLLGVIGIVGLATEPEPLATPSPAPSPGQAAPPSLPLAAAPIVPATPSTAASTPFDEVASAAPPRSGRPSPASAQVTVGDDQERAPTESREGGNGNDKKDEKKDDKKGDRGSGGGRGRGN